MSDDTIEKAGRAFCDVVVGAIHDKVRSRGGSASLSGSEYYMYPPVIEAFDKAIEAALNVAILAERQRCAEVAKERFSGEAPRSASRNAGIEISRTILAPVT